MGKTGENKRSEEQGGAVASGSQSGDRNHLS